MHATLGTQGHCGNAGITDITRSVTAVAKEIAMASAGSAAERVAQSLSVYCEAFDNSIWPEVAWRFSGLTADGCPLEFTFSSVDNSLRYTVDVAPPETQNHDRIAAADGLLVRLDCPRPGAETMARWILMQRNHHLLWGARLGVRESGNSEAAKFYLEVPLAAQPSIRSQIDPPIKDSIAVMIGYDPASAITEYYFRQQTLSRPHLDALLGIMSSDEERTTMLAGIEHLCGMPVASALKWTCFGYSLATSPGLQSAPKFTLFARSRAIGGAVCARQRLLSSMPFAVKQRSVYRKLVAGLLDSQLPDHGVVSLYCDHSGVAEMRVGLSGIALSQLLERSQSCE